MFQVLNFFEINGKIIFLTFNVLNRKFLKNLTFKKKKIVIAKLEKVQLSNEPGKSFFNCLWRAPYTLAKLLPQPGMGSSA